MNSISFSIGYMLTILMVCVSSKDYHIMSDKNKVTKHSPYNFSYFTKSFDFLLMEITLKNIPASVTSVYLVYSMKNNFLSKDTKPERVKIESEIKNGELNILILRSLNNGKILVDVELQSREGLCTRARVAEGRLADNDPNYWNATLGYQIYWYTGWKYDDSGDCLVPNLCEIVVDFQSQCEETLKCSIDETKYICTFYTGKMKKNKPYILYQTYDTDKQITTPTLWKDYTYINAVDSLYKIHTTPKNWHDAKKVCVKEGANLFYPENKDEADAVISFWNQYQESIAYMYVGISDIKTEGLFVTIDGQPISELYYNWRKPDQPDNYGNEDCVHMSQKGEYNDISCSYVYSFICKKSLPHNLSSVIGAPLYITANYTRFIIELESFDNNASVHVQPSGHEKNISRSDIIYTKEVVKNIVKVQTYTETTEVQFSCKEFTHRLKHVYLALINKTENKIQTLDKSLILKRKFKKADSGSILCCLYYVYDSKNDGNEAHITRYVVNKTLLKYQVNESMSANPAGVEEQSTSSNDNDYNWLIYLSAAVLGVSVLILALYIISKKRCSTDSQPLDETVELDNQTSQDQVLYANLDFENNANQPPNQNEESHYANIAAVLHPL